MARHDLNHIAHILAAAAAAFGHPLTVVDVPIQGSVRSVVVRARVGLGPRTVVVKWFDPAAAGEGWLREGAALSVLADLAVPAPSLLAFADDPPVLVMTDLGRGDALADRLLGCDRQAAGVGLLDWARAMGKLHRSTTNQRAEFVAALARFAGDLPADADTTDSWLLESAGVLRRQLPHLGVEPAEPALAELAEINLRMRTELYALTPADACPDNNIFAPGGLSLLDFEGAVFRHMAWDVTYLSVPWPSCWCAWRIDQVIADRAVEGWRTELRALRPEVDSADFEADLMLAGVGWAWGSTAWLADLAVAGDPLVQRLAIRDLTPPRRAMIQHRLSQVLRWNVKELPALTELAGQTLAALRELWGDVPLELAPAFRRGG